MGAVKKVATEIPVTTRERGRSVATGEVGTLMVSKDLRKVYRVETDGSWRRLPREAAKRIIAEHQRKDAEANEKEAVAQRVVLKQALDDFAKSAKVEP